MSIYRDPKKISDFLKNWIRERFSDTRAKGAVLGISGGIDSAVAAALLAETLGPDKVIGVIMPCHSMPVDEEYARMLADKIKIKTIKIDLSATYDTLEKCLAEGGSTPDGLAAANIKPRLRMTTLYAIAQQNGFLVCGCSNKAEMTYGYFTKYGDSGVDLLPIADLLKGEVRTLAEYLGVPRCIIDRPPTAGLWEGQTDEAEMGLSYDELDRYIAEGKARTAADSRIKAAFTSSEHKRKFPPIAKLPDTL